MVGSLYSSIGLFVSNNNWFDTPDRIWSVTLDSNIFDEIVCSLLVYIRVNTTDCIKRFDMHPVALCARYDRMKRIAVHAVWQAVSNFTYLRQIVL